MLRKVVANRDVLLKIVTKLFPTVFEMDRTWVEGRAKKKLSQRGPGEPQTIFFKDAIPSLALHCHTRCCVRLLQIVMFC